MEVEYDYATVEDPILKDFIEDRGDKVKGSPWLSRIDKDAKESRDKRIFDLWLGCYTQEEIAKIANVVQQTMSEWINSFTENPPIKNSVKPASSHLTEIQRWSVGRAA